jgi:hypothetical protein
MQSKKSPIDSINKAKISGFKPLSQESIHLEGFLYAIKYTRTRLAAHYNQIVNILGSFNIVYDQENRLFVDNSDYKKHKNRDILLEEYLVLFQATNFKDYGVNSIADFSNIFLDEIDNSILKGDIPNAMYYIDFIIPTNIKALRKVHQDSKCLNNKDVKYLDNLEETIKKIKEPTIDFPICGKVYPNDSIHTIH